MADHLYRENPPIDLVSRILKPLNVYLNILPTQFSKTAINKYQWQADDLAELIPYYYPCMLERFFKDEYPINTVTIIRQLLKAHDYEFKTVEMMSEYKKSYVYHISKKTKDSHDSEIVLSFS